MLYNIRKPQIFRPHKKNRRNSPHEEKKNKVTSERRKKKEVLVYITQNFCGFLLWFLFFSMKNVKPDRLPRARNYMFTINYGENEDGSAPDYQQLTPAEDRWDELGVRYCRWQLEVGAEGVEHIQGYLELAAPLSMVAVHKIPGLERSALFKREGSASQADAYCSKVDTRVDGPWTFGVSLCLSVLA